MPEFLQNFALAPAHLDVSVFALGLALFLLESFREPLSKIRWLGSISEEFNAQRFSGTIAMIALLVLIILFVLSFFANTSEIPQIAQYSGSAQAVFFKQIALLSTILVIFMSTEYSGTLSKFLFGKNAQAGLSEYYSLPVFTCGGLMLMASARDFILIFCALELVTISFYILVAFMRRNIASLEAGAKYLVLGALSTGFFVYGIAWIFGATGTTNLDQIATASGVVESRNALLFGFGLVVVGLGFKIAAVPFQIWVPDVYQGAPTPTTAYLSVGSKAAGFIVLINVATAIANISPEFQDKVVIILAILAAATLIYGNLAAIPQYNLKRLLAYSSIGHAGYLLIGVATGYMGGVAFYLWAYLLMTMLAFIIMIVVANNNGGSDDISSFNGLIKRSPFLTFSMIVAMLSLAGVPFTAGFVGKFLIFKDAVNNGQIALCIIGALAVAAGFYYYLKVVRAMCLEQPDPSNDGSITMAPQTRVIIVLLVLAIFVFGIYYLPIMERIG